MASRTDAVRLGLQEAALMLYSERGYDGTTVAAIAGRAGVTERTYFRHFADKREVLFANEGELTDLLRTAVAEASADAAAPQLARLGVEAVARALKPRRAELLRREAVVAATPELRERERSKLGGWQQELDEALCRRQVAAGDAALAAGLAVAVLDTTARRWLAAAFEDDLLSLMDEAFARAGRFIASGRNSAAEP